jgi:hypothetical protein
MPVFRRRATDNVSTNSSDELREQKLDMIKQLAERFTYDLALLIAGHPVELEAYLAPAAAARLRASIQPFLDTGDAMRPNFGEYGELRVEGNLLSNDQPIQAFVEFDDQSVRETAAGDLMPTGRKRMLLSMLIDPSCRGISDYSLKPAERVTP